MNRKLIVSFLIATFVSANTGFAVTKTCLEENPESGLRTMSIHSKKAPRTITIDIDENYRFKKNTTQPDVKDQKNSYCRKRNPFLTGRCKFITSLVTGFTLLLAVGFSCYVFLYSSLLDPFTPTPNFTSSEEAIDSLVCFDAHDGVYNHAYDLKGFDRDGSVSEETINSFVWFEADDGGRLKYDLDDSNDSYKYWLDMIGRNTKKNLHSR
jgi:hypothetical protein